MREQKVEEKGERARETGVRVRKGTQGEGLFVGLFLKRARKSGVPLGPKVSEIILLQ